MKKGTFIPESEFHEKENKKSAPPQAQASEPVVKTEPNEDAKRDTQRDHKTSEHNDSRNQGKVNKSSFPSKTHTRSSEIAEVEQKKKEVKSEYKSTKKSTSDDKPIASSINKDVASTIRTESRASSASSSPKRNIDHRSKEDNDGESLNTGKLTKKLDTNDYTVTEKEYKKRKMESKVSF